MGEAGLKKRGNPNWKPGWKGGPGRPRGRGLGDWLNRVLDEVPSPAMVEKMAAVWPDAAKMTNRELIARRLIAESLLNGNLRASELVAERSEGKVAQAVDLSVKEPIRIVPTFEGLPNAGSTVDNHA
jgi:hypothetical protein